jgi:hypothetical protein
MVDSKKEFNLAEILSNGSNRKRFKMKRVYIDGYEYYTVNDSLLNYKRAIMLLNDNSMLIERDLFASYLELIILNSILSQIPNHFILHAGVVSLQEKGIVLCGMPIAAKAH